MSDPNNAPSTDASLSPDASAPSAAPAETSIDPAQLKTAYSAFKKRWKLTRLDYESRIGKSPLSSGGRNAIVGITAPKEFPKTIWEELVKQGRLKRAGSGLYAMP